MGLWTAVPISDARANQAILKQEFILEDNQKGRMSAFSFFFFLSLSLSGKQNRKEIFTYCQRCLSGYLNELKMRQINI